MKEEAKKFCSEGGDEPPASLFRALTDDDRHLEPVLTEVRPNLDVIPGGEQIEYADAGLARQGV